MPGAYTGDEREAAVERLVRARLDREGGDGAYDEAVARIAADGARAPALLAALERARDRARRNVDDVLAALGGGNLCHAAPTPNLPPRSHP